MADKLDVMNYIREIIKNEVSLDIKKVEEGISLQLKLGPTPIGEKFEISNHVQWGVDSGHGGERYVDGVTIDLIKKD
jgi:hypothetical protein